MKKKSVFRIQQWDLLLYVFFVLGVFSLTSCNKDVPNLLKEYPSDIAANAGKAKVLYIVADGLRGNAMQDLEPANFKKFKRKSLYTFGSLADTSTVEMTNESGWANLITGVEPKKHQVINGDLSKLNVAYPTVFSQLKNSAKAYKSIVYASSDKLGEHLTDGVENKFTYGGDDSQTFSAALKEVKEGDADLVFVQFEEVEKVGQASSYESKDADYAKAIYDLDEKVGQLIEGLEGRADYSKEDWLVIFTSNKGGEVETDIIDNTVYGDASRNTFTAFYSPKFAERVLARPNSQEIPFIGNAVRYTAANPAVNARLDEAQAFNFGNNKDFTINLFLKVTNPGGAWNYPIFFAKRVSGFGGNGWNFFGESRDGNTVWGFNSNIGGQVFGDPVNDGEWKVITLVVERSGEQDSIKAFTNGKFNQGQVANGNDLNNPAPLVIGRWAGNDNTSADWIIANVQIYNTAFTREEVKEYAGITHIDETHPKYSSLIGYWPGYDDVNTGFLTEKTGRAGDMRLTGPYTWMNFTDINSFLKPPVSYAFYRNVPNAVDVPFMIYKWMGVNTPTNWGLDGRSWTPRFSDIRE